MVEGQAPNGSEEALSPRSADRGLDSDGAGFELYLEPAVVVLVEVAVGVDGGAYRDLLGEN